VRLLHATTGEHTSKLSLSADLKRCTLGMPQQREASLVDDQEFEEAWHVHGASILRYCRFAVGSPDTGEDIAAETFARFLQRGEGVASEKVEAWLFTVARNLVRSHQRRASRWLSVSSRLQRAHEPSAETHHGSSLAELLGPLGPGERLAVYLRIVEDRPFAEVAQITSKSEAATKKTVYRALARLRRIDERGKQTISHRGGVEHE
jgi:RNA polymerase sigma factor (sigma-70 family)